MNKPTEWSWGRIPVETGWYATTHCWESQEGMFPGADYWDGAKWESGLPIIGCAGPFDSEIEAKKWACDHDVET